MRLILLGLPGVGKGTQAVEISTRYDIPHISTGDILRENIKLGSELGKLAEKYLGDGKLVPDEVVLDIVKSRLAEADCKKGFLMDGFPRTAAQALAFDQMLDEENLVLDKVIKIDGNKEAIVKRTSGRRVCKECKATYNIESKPTKRPGICDACGGEVYQRDDDKAETVKRRIEIYLEQTKPLQDYYNEKGCLVRIDGLLEIDTVTELIIKALEG